MIRIIRATGYLVIALAVLVAIPWAAIRFVGWPLPRAVPDGATLQEWFEDPFAPVRFWKAISVVGWLIWAALVFFLITEILALLGRFRLPRIRLAAPLQGLAAGMVGATATALTASAAHAAPSPPAVAAVPDLDARAETPVPDESFYVVEHGDWLSSIAARFLGDPNAYPRIQALNPGLEARDARFPNHIEPGWRLVMPSDAVEHGIRRHAAGKLHRTTTPTPTATNPNGSDPAVRQNPASPGPANPTGTPHTNDPTRGAAAQADPTKPADHLDGDGDGHPDVFVGGSTTGAMAGAGLLASLLFAVLTAERRRQRGFYAAGQQPALPANGKAERELRAAQQPADVERLDLALRTLNHGLIGDRVRPDIVGVRLIGGEVQVLLGRPDEDPPPPWLDEGTQWALPAYLEPTITGRQATLLPMLATIGSRAGRHLLIDLERLGTLSIGGHPYRVRDLLRHIVCELACSTWSEEAHIILTGFGDEGDSLAEIGPHRISTAATAATAISTVADELAQRTNAIAGPPTVLIVANPDAGTRAALTDLHHALTKRGRCGIAVVATVPDGAQIGPAVLTVSDTGLLTADLPGLRLSTDAATVPVDMLEPMAQVFRAAHLPPTPPTDDLPPWDDTIDPSHGVLALFEPTTPDPTNTTPPTVITATAPAAPDPLDDDIAAWHDGTATPPRIAVLGPIQVHMPGTLTDSRHRLYTELLLYLLTRPTRSADRATIEDALWYGHPAGQDTVRKAASKLRQWLAKRPDGQDWIPVGDEGVYRVEDGVLLDWHLMLRLRQRASTRGTDGITDLQTALALIRGAPMRNLPDRGPYRRPYTWIGDSDIAPGRLIATIADIAHRVAEYHLTAGDTATARWAVEQAWLADPDRSFDDLWYDQMRVEHQDGHTAALQQLVTEYLTAREAEVLEDLPTPTYNRIRALIPTA